jgi:hypothetical protein
MKLIYMGNKILLEFFPEFEFLRTNDGLKSQKIEVQLLQSRSSIKLYKTVRFLKSKFKYKFSVTDNKKNRSLGKQILIIKKCYNYKSYRIGKKPKSFLLPALIVDGVFLGHGKIHFHRELESVFDELCSI